MADDKRSKNLRPPWKAGDPSPNPAGRPKDPEALKNIRKLTKQELDEIFDLILFGTRTDLKDAIERDDTPVLKLWIAKLCWRAVEEDDPNALETLEKFLDRTLGKNPSTSKVDVTGNIHTMLVDMVNRMETE